MNTDMDLNLNLNKLKQAVAIHYDLISGRINKTAPKIMAKGTGTIAAKIVEIAQENEIPLYEEPDLTALLMKLELGSEIPPELFDALAGVLAWVYTVNKRGPGNV